MPDYTGKLAAPKPLLVGEVIDPALLRTAFDKFDAAAGATEVSSGSRPSSPYNGQIIRESDTKRLLVWNTAQDVWQTVSSERPMAIMQHNDAQFGSYNDADFAGAHPFTPDLVNPDPQRVLDILVIFSGWLAKNTSNGNSARAQARLSTGGVGTGVVAGHFNGDENANTMVSTATDPNTSQSMSYQSSISPGGSVRGRIYIASPGRTSGTFQFSYTMLQLIPIGYRWP